MECVMVRGRLNWKLAPNLLILFREVHAALNPACLISKDR